MGYYSEEIKREALRLYYSEGLGARRICKRLGIRYPSYIRYWVINYSAFGEDSFDRRKKHRLGSLPTPAEFYQYCSSIAQENQRIKSENAFLSYTLDLHRPNRKYELIAECTEEPVAKLCKLGHMSRSGFYKWKADQERKNASKEYDDLLNIVREIYEASGGTYGYRRIDKALRKKGIIVNHKRLQRILRENDLQSKLYVVRKNRWTTHTEKKDLLRQNFYADKPNEKWATDITFFSHFLQTVSCDVHHGSV